MFNTKNLSLLIVLVFALTMIIPAGAAFAANYAVFSSSYSFTSTGNEQNAGTVTVKADEPTVCDAVYINLTLPEGVNFTNTPNSDDIGDFALVQSDASISFVSSSPNYINVWLSGSEWVGTDSVTFDFTAITGYENNKLDIEKDFSGNLYVEVEIIGLDDNKIIWVNSDDLIIAKVAQSDLTIKAGTLREVSVGENKLVAKITVGESHGGLIQKDSIVTLIIETENVEFNNLSATGENGIALSPATLIKVDDKQIKAEVIVTHSSSTFPGKITFDPICLDIAVNEKKDIEITITVSELDENETVTVATVDDAEAKVDKLENNDTVAFSGQITALDTSMKIQTGGIAFENGGIMTFRLNKGEFAADPIVDTDKVTLKRYDYNKAFFVYFNDNLTNFTLEHFKIKLNNDIEPGDITLAISGDYGDLNDIVIGFAAVPIVVTNTYPSDGATGIRNSCIIQVSFNQRVQAGNDFNRIEVKDNDNNVVNMIMFIDDKKLIISPVENLSHGTTYTVTIPATAITDLVGNPLINDYLFAFTTESPSSGNGGGGGGPVSKQSNTANDNDISDRVNDLLENAGKGDTITVVSSESGFQIINNATLQNISDTGCNLSINAQNAGTSLIFEPGALLTNELAEAGKDALVEIATSIVEADEAQEAANYAISVGGKTLRAYNLNISVKEDEKDDGTEIHTLNGNVDVILDLSDMDLDEVNTDLLTVVHQQPDGTWLEVESVFDPEIKTISFTTNSFSMFAVIEKVLKENKVIELTIGQMEASIDGHLYTLDVKPYVNNMTNRTFVPLRFISEALGARVDWVAETNNIAIKDVNKEITLTVGSKDVSVNNDTIVIDAAPEMIPPGRCFVPLRFISETIGAQVNYDSSSKQITITTEGRMKEL